jgi:molybdopterin converting factor small subunit
MKILVRAGGSLREVIKPDVDQFTRKVEIDDGKNIGDIIQKIQVDKRLIAFIYVDGKIKDYSYVPKDGQTITLQPPVSGG